MSRGRLLSIGQFARITGITVRALRHYDELGLLRPAYVDRDTGYRYYRNAQAGDALALRRLRELELPLDEIAELLASRDEAALARALAAHRDRMALRATQLDRVLREVNAYLADAGAVFASPDEPTRRHLPAQTVVAVRFAPEPDPVRAAQDAFRRGRTFLLERKLAPSGPATLVAPFAGELEEHLLEAAWPVAEPIEDARDGDVVSNALPACDVVAILHRGSYRDLDRPYRVLSNYIEEHDLATAGPPREIYLTSSQETEPDAAVTEIVWPIVASSEARSRET